MKFSFQPLKAMGSFISINAPLFGRALREVSINAGAALMPVWAGAILSIIFVRLDIKEALYSNISRGDLFIGATAAAAPIALYMTEKSKGLPPRLNWKFPFALYYILSVNLLFCVCIILFTMKRLHDLKLMNIEIDESRFTILSLISFGFSTLLAMAVTFTRQKLDERDFSAATESNMQRAQQAWASRNRDND